MRSVKRNFTDSLAASRGKPMTSPIYFLKKLVDSCASKSRRRRHVGLNIERLETRRVLASLTLIDASVSGEFILEGPTGVHVGAIDSLDQWNSFLGLGKVGDVSSRNMSRKDINENLGSSHQVDYTQSAYGVTAEAGVGKYPHTRGGHVNLFARTSTEVSLRIDPSHNLEQIGDRVDVLAYFGGGDVQEVDIPEEPTIGSLIHITLDQSVSLAGHTDLGGTVSGEAWAIIVVTPRPNLVMNNVSWDAAGDIVGEYDVIQSIGGTAPIAFYWSTDTKWSSDDLPATDPEHPLTTASGSGTHQFRLGGVALLQPPDTHKHLVVYLDPPSAGMPEGSLLEARESDNEAAVTLLDLEVSAEFDEPNNGETVFGRYLPGVRLFNEFTVLIPDLADNVASITATASDESVALPNFVRDGTSNRWTSSSPIDMGLFEADSTITISVEYGVGLEQIFTGSIALANPLDLEVTVTADESDVEDLRLIPNIPLGRRLLFASRIEGSLPLANVGNPYEPMLDLYLVGASGETPFQASFIDDQPSLRPVDHIGPGNYEIVVKAGDAFRTRDLALSDGESLLSIALPEWMGTPLSKSFDDDSYSLELMLPAFLSKDFPTTSGTPFGLFDGLESRIGAGAIVTIDAPLIAPSHARASVELQALKAEVKLLGEELYSQTISAVDLNVSADESSLDARELNSGMVVLKSATPLDLLRHISEDKRVLFDLSIGGSGQTTFQLNLAEQAISAIKALTTITATPAFGFNGELTGKLSSATLDWGVAFDASNGTLDESSTFLEVKAKADARLALSLSAEVSLLGFSIVDGSLAGSLDAWAHVEGKLQFAGSVLIPHAHAFQALGSAGIDASIDYSLNVVEHDVVSGTLSFNPKGFELFRVPNLARGFEADTQFELRGNVQFPSGIPGVEPKEGDSFALLGLELDDNRTAASALRFSMPVDQSLEGIAYEMNVLADVEQIAPNRHYLEVVLIGSEILVHRIDLSTVPLFPSEHPLGYASGWRVKAGVPQEVLQSAHPYQVEFRLVNTSEMGDERVAVALDDLQLNEQFPSVRISSIDAELESGELRFLSSTARIELQNTGARPSIIRKTRLTGSGFILRDAPADNHILYPGDAPTAFVLESTEPIASDARLLIEVDDPVQPLREFRLIASTASSTPEDVTDRVVTNFYGRQYNRRTGVFGFYASITNNADVQLVYPIRLLLTELGPAGTTVENAHGTLEDGTPYFDFAGTAALAPGETTEAVVIAIKPPPGTLYTFTPQVLAVVTDGGGTEGDSAANSSSLSGGSTTAFPKPSFQNSNNRYDVNADGLVTAFDVLTVINHLNREPNLIAADLAAAIELTPSPWVDVNGDGNVWPLDILHIITELNRRSRAGRVSMPEGEIGGFGEITPLYDLGLEKSVEERERLLDGIYAELAQDATDPLSVVYAEQAARWIVPEIAGHAEEEESTGARDEMVTSDLMADLSWLD